MRYFFAALALAILVNTGCKKDNCNRVTIISTGNPCVKWGIKKNADTYLADSIPGQFQRDGMVVCAKYFLYEDLRLCPSPCCGGIRAHVTSMSVLPE